MLEGLPLEYDVIVIGTGMVESIVAAACARAGKTVLHIDTNEYYGSEWTSFPLNGLIEWVQKQEKYSDENCSIEKKDDTETIVLTSNPSKIFRNVHLTWNIEKSAPVVEDSSSLSVDENPKITLDQLEKQSRRFNIDLTPKLYYSTGGLIDLLVQSNVAKYCEFKLVSRLLLEQNNRLDNVPSSRADIFNSNEISLIDKRLLMKVMMNCSSAAAGEQQIDLELPFIDYLKKQKLNDNLCHLVINSVAMVDYSATTKEGLAGAKRYLDSIGRYGNSPFLYPLYGNGEMSQCFCRLCAVFGGFYFLHFPLAGLTVDSQTNSCSGIVTTTGEHFRAKDAVVCNNSFLASIPSNPSIIRRTVLFTNRSIKSSDKDEITYLRLSNPNESGIHVIEVGHGSGCTPDGFFLVYIFQEQPQSTSSIDIDSIVERLLNRTGDDFTQMNILGRLTFDQIETITTSSSSSPFARLLFAYGPDGSIHHDTAMNKAREIFSQICTNGEEFLARAPDPEDIVIEDNNSSSSNSNTVDPSATSENVE